MLVDHARIHVIAGKGGDGCISFRREKYVPKGGPDGGDGGKGGDVIVEVGPHVRTLLDFRERPTYRAGKGGSGSGNRRSGKDGEELVLRVPAGTVVRDVTSGEVIGDLVASAERLVLARGGRGGRGNARFATPTRQAPRHAEPGETGEERTVEFELKLIADVGFVGLPNAGKSTLLARVSRARPRVGPYPFTTLEPNLGIVQLDDERQFVAADLPGLIEGAHAGRGLGLQFLRHVERTRALAFLLDGTNPDPLGDLALLEREVSLYSAALMEKPRVVVLTKADLSPPPETGRGRPSPPGALVISSHTGEGIRELLEALWRLLATDPAGERALGEARGPGAGRSPGV